MNKMELKNMYAIAEENKDLKEDLQRMKTMTYEDRMKEVMDENTRLRRRNGELIIKMSHIEDEIEALKSQGSDIKLEVEAQMGYLRASNKPVN